MKGKKIIMWLSRLVAAGILLQTLFFKFTAHPDSVMLFSTLGVEPYGRIALGVVELIVGIGLLIPKTTLKASYAAITIMVGAIASHLFVIGVSFNNDGGALFGLAIAVLVASLVNLVLTKKTHHVKK